MKTISPLLIVLLFFISCDKESLQELEVLTTSVSLLSKDSTQIQATSDSKITYEIENTFLASVSETGMVKASRIGESFINVNANSKTVGIPIEIIPRHNTYDEPPVTSSSALSKFDLNGDDYLEFNGGKIKPNYSEKASFIAYIFDDNNNLIHDFIIGIKGDYRSEILQYLGERYKAFYSYEKGYMWYNAENFNDASVAVYYVPTTTLSWVKGEPEDDSFVCYTPINNRSEDVIKEVLNTNYNRLLTSRYFGLKDN